MCFRPATIDEVQVCPSCGKQLRVIKGIKQKECPFCKTELSDQDMLKANASPDASNRKSAGAPIASAATAPPKAPTTTPAYPTPPKAPT